jgi:hypothetical protein
MLAGFGERLFRRALLLIALAGLVLGGVAAALGRSEWASDAGQAAQSRSFLGCCSPSSVKCWRGGGG